MSSSRPRAASAAGATAPPFPRDVPVPAARAPSRRLAGSSSALPIRAIALWLFVASAAGLFFAARVSAVALQNAYVVEEDIRQHLFWIPRLHDPELFPRDPIADYFAAQAPPLFVALYYLGTFFVDAITISKILPLVMTLFLAGSGLFLGWRLFRRVDAAGLAAVLLVWSAWQYDDIASATSRSFAMPLLVLFLAFLVGRQRRAVLATLTISALTYPPDCAIMLGAQGLWLLWRARLGLFNARFRSELLWLVAAVAVSGAVLLAERAPTARYGPMISAAESQTMPEFQAGGRASFWVSDPVRFWLDSTHSGLGLRRRDRLLGGLPSLTIPFSLAAALALWMLVGKLGLVPGPAVPRRAGLLVALLISSFVLFFAAHALLFRLYLPSRQVQFSLPIVWAMFGGLLLALLAERLSGVLLASRGQQLAGLLAGLAVAGLVLHPPPPGDFYLMGRYNMLYDYLLAQPKDTLVAALPADSSDLPLFAQRPVLVSWEHGLAYQLAYYLPLQQKTEELLNAYVATSPREIVDFAEREGVDVVVANTSALEKYRRERSNQRLGLETLVDRCAAVRDRELAAIPMDCAKQFVAQR